MGGGAAGEGEKARRAAAALFPIPQKSSGAHWAHKCQQPVKRPHARASSYCLVEAVRMCWPLPLFFHVKSTEYYHKFLF